MDTKGKTSASGGDVVELIPSEEGSKGVNTSRDAKGPPLKDSESTATKQCTFVDLLDKGAAPMSHRSPEIAAFSPSPSSGRNKPPPEIPDSLDKGAAPMSHRSPEIAAFSPSPSPVRNKPPPEIPDSLDKGAAPMSHRSPEIATFSPGPSPGRNKPPPEIPDSLDKGAAPMSHRSPEIATFSPGPSPGRNKPPPKISDSVDEGAAPMSHRARKIARFSPSPSPSRNKPPKIPKNKNLMRRAVLAGSMCWIPKSRSGEKSYPVDHNVFEERERDGQGANSPFRNPTSNRASPNNRAPLRNTSITPETPLMASPGGVGVDEYEEICKKMNSQLSKEKSKKVKTKVLVEWVAFVCILGCLVASLTVEELLNSMLWGFEIWKWCVLVMVIFCGKLVTNWITNILVFIIERNLLLRKKVLYFVHGLKKSVQVFIWFVLILLTWVLLFNRGVERSANATKILDFITWTIVSFLIGAFLWLFKTLSLKILASSFHVNAFFDRIQESVFHQYVLQKLHKMKQGNVSSWTMKVIVDALARSGPPTLSNTLDETVNDGGGEQTGREITSEMEAMAAAYDIFRNVAPNDSKYIVKDDLMNFMIKEEVDLVFPLFGVAAETGQIDFKCLTDWVVKVYEGRKALAHALNDTKTAVKQLNKLVMAILIVGMIIVWLLLVGIVNTKGLVILSQHLVPAAFIFGNTCKTIFEAIIFVFVTHPFDVGDRCMIDGIQMVVEEQNILSTVFLKFDNEKIYYPNSVLSTKPISNFYRSPDMVDNIEFCLDFMTPVEKIGNLKDKIRKHLERKSLHWHPGHNLVVAKEFENMSKIKMDLFFSHTMNFQDFAEKTKRRSELVIELKKIFEELDIKYNLLPQEVHLSNVGPATMTTGTTTR